VVWRVINRIRVKPDIINSFEAYRKAYDDAHRDILRERHRRYYDEHRDEILAKSREYKRQKRAEEKLRREQEKE